jgi:hypothetical protein
MFPSRAAADHAVDAIAVRVKHFAWGKPMPRKASKNAPSVLTRPTQRS